MKRRVSMLLLILTLFAISPFVTAVAQADTLDELDSSDSYEYDYADQKQDQGTGDIAADSITDYMKGYNAVSPDSMKKASGMTSTVTNLIGYAIGIILILTMSLVGLITVLDLLYIAVPFTRNLLYPGGQVSTPTMGGMPGGYGMHGGMQQQQQASGGRKFVSDEALAALAESGSGAATPQASPSPYGGGLYGGGPYGGGMMQQQQAPKAKSVMFVYLKKRIVFLVLFAVASIVLFSSVFTDCGINIAKLFMKVMGMVNGGIDSVEIG